MLPSSARSIGEQSVTTLPSNRSIIIADSAARKDNQIDTPYNFNCDLSGTAIYAKEIYYQKLFWNQPIFSHNNASCELLFQLNGDTGTTYVVYALPFVMYQLYDGNAAGTSLLTPQVYSYADMMEKGLNSDVRVMPLNTTLVNGTGIITDPTDPLHPITLRYRYSPTRGFCIYPEQDSPTPGYYYSIRLLPCSYVNNGHYVHGFGYYDASGDTIEYVPHGFFSVAVWSDCTPNLLPTRYIVTQSQELNKDRRLISFHNGNFANFINELGIFSINPARTGVFHEVGVGDDATVISLRDDYTPQTFRIQILDEYGNVFLHGDPLSALLQSSGIDPYVTSSYMSGPLQGRGNSTFINYMVFGYKIFRDSVLLGVLGVLNNAVPNPVGMNNSDCIFQNINYNLLNFNDYIDLSKCTPLVLTTAGFSPSPAPQGVGFNSSTWSAIPFQPRGVLNNFTILTWYPNLNPFPQIRWDFEFENPIITTPGAGQAYLFIVMFDATTYEVIMSSKISTLNTSPSLVPYISFGPAVSNWSRSSTYVFPPSPATIQVGFCLAWIGLSTVFVGKLFGMYGASTPPGPVFTIENPNNGTNIQTEYDPPELTTLYTFGNPLAIALEEEVIHEIAAILEYN